MITKWKLANFKSAKSEKELALGPLTIFAGANSSGKSTLLQSMLLISQTLSSNVSSRSVVLNGPLVKLGQFDDLLSQGTEAQQISIGWECEPLPELRTLLPDIQERTTRCDYLFSIMGDFLSKVECDISFGIDLVDQEQELMQLQPDLADAYIACCFHSQAGITADSHIMVGGYEQRDLKKRAKESSLYSIPPATVRANRDYAVTIDKNSITELRKELTDAVPVSCVLRHFLPTQIFVRFDQVDEFRRSFQTAIIEALEAAHRQTASARRRQMRVRYRYKDFVIPPPIATFLMEMPPDPKRALTIKGLLGQLNLLPHQERISKLKALQEAIRRNHTFIREAFKKEQGGDRAIQSGRLPEHIYRSARYMEVFFSSSFRYLGPLRDEPKSLYPLGTTSDPFDVGLRGEYTAAVLNVHKSRQVNYLSPGNFSKPASLKESETSSLEAAVTNWMRYLDLAEGIETRDRGKLGHELKVLPAGMKKPQDLTHVGVGVSQVLPILVMCLLAEADTTLIFEQPELHLHPLVQTRLADFFISMALLGKQCIIETHSEYLINRLRFRVASAPKEELSSLIKTYFVEKREGDSSFREVTINRFGAILDWPVGFFDQSQDESAEILRAATVKRKKEREELNNG